MEETTPPQAMPTVTPTPSVPQKKPQNKKIIIAILFVVLLIIVSAIILLLGPFVPGKAPNAPVMKVGDETIYQNDIDYNLTTFYPKAGTSSATLQEAKKAVENKIVEESIIIQEAQKDGIIKPTTREFNSVNKDITSRNQLITAAKEKITNKFVSRVTGSAISIWFNNTSFPPPSIGTESAKQIVKQKIDTIYADLKTEKITFGQAVKKIRDDTSLAAIDPSYKANAYAAFVDRTKEEPIFNDPDVNDVLWSFKAGEMSPVLLVNDFGGKDRKPFEALYKILKVSKINNDPFNDFAAWFAAKKPNYAITIY